MSNENTIVGYNLGGGISVCVDHYNPRENGAYVNEIHASDEYKDNDIPICEDCGSYLDVNNNGGF